MSNNVKITNFPALLQISLAVNPLIFNGFLPILLFYGKAFPAQGFVFLFTYGSGITHDSIWANGVCNNLMLYLFRLA